jgi:pyruvate formate lyase activating enzyme
MGASSPRGEVHGEVLQIQRMSTEDGPGLRSTAFLKGCPLACAWCHNPESIGARPELQWMGQLCIGCGSCVAVCGRGAISRGADGAVSIDRAACSACERTALGPRAADGAGPSCPAAEACPTGALELLGKRYAASELAAELLKDSPYFARSDRGGITLSGGEASAQPEFALEVFRMTRAAGLHAALDTCGFAPWEALEALYPEVDLVLWDLKECDPERHRAFTGRDNARILGNFGRTAAYMDAHATPSAMWIRTPVIPGATDREENLYGLGRLVGRVAPPRLERWELCAFNNLCADKYRRLGRDWAFASAPLMTALDMSRLAAAAKRGIEAGSAERGEGRAAIDPAIVSWTGSTRIEPERN